MSVGRETRWTRWSIAGLLAVVCRSRLLPALLARWPATGDIIAPQNNPHTPADGWQAGTCTTDTPQCSVDTPGQFFERSRRPPAGRLHPVHRQIHRRPLPGRKTRSASSEGPGRPPGRPHRQPPGDPPVRRRRPTPANCATSAPLSQVGTSAVTLSVAGVVTAAGDAAHRSPVYNLVPADGRTGALRPHPRRQQRLPQSRRRLGRRLPRGIHDRRARTRPLGADPDQPPRLQRARRRRHLHHHPVAPASTPNRPASRGSTRPSCSPLRHGRIGVGLRLPAERRAAVRIAAARRQKADRLRERPLRTDASRSTPARQATDSPSGAVTDVKFPLNPGGDDT